MRRKGLHGLLVLSCSLGLGLGCRDGGGGGVLVPVDGGWEPVDGKDAKPDSLIVPVLHRDEMHTLTFRIFNNGSETIPAGFQARLQVFEDASYSVAYCAPITVTQPTDIASGKVADVEFLLPIDIATPVGTTLYLVATADSLDDVVEAIETNNSVERLPQVALERRADLKAREPFAPEIFRDETNAVVLGALNDGDKTAPAGFRATLEVYEDASYATPFCAPILVTCPADVLPGKTVGVEFPLPVDVTVLVGTTLYLVATIDTLDEVEEFSEANNAVETSVQVAPERMPDLIVEDIGLPVYMRRDQTYDVTVTVRNVDNEAAIAPFSVELVEPSASWSFTWQVDTDLAPGADEVLTTSYTVASGAPAGDITFTATADTTAAVVERDEGNNALSQASPIATMDLRIQLVDGPSGALSAGVPYTFTFRVTNPGTMPSPSTHVSIFRCHVDASIVVHFDDVRQTWPSATVPSLPPGGAMDFDSTLTSTVSSSSGIALIFQIDPNDLIAEESETNNIAGVVYPPL